MILFPAIDIYNQKAVRLKQGNFKDMTIYHDHPLSIIEDFMNQGAEYLHMVDLNAAEDSSLINQELIKTILKTNDLPIQLGGGIRTIEQGRYLLSLGIKRIIIGTSALNIDLLKEMILEFKDQLVVSIDSKDGRVATHGWKETSSIDAFNFCRQLEDMGIKTIVYTDISKDGMLKGPQFSIYEKLVKHTNLEVIASGGISSLDDLIRLKDMGLYGTIIGKALYEKRFTLKEAISCLQNASSLV